MYNHSSIKLDQLVKCIKRVKYNKLDQNFLKNNLTTEHYNQLLIMLKDQKLKTKHHKPIIKSSLTPYCIAIFNQPMFASELSTHYARLYKDKRIAIIDVNRINPSLDIYLNVLSPIKTGFNHLSYDKATGINLLLDGLENRVLNKQSIDHISIRIEGFRNLYYFSGSYLIEDYEKISAEAYQNLIKLLKKTYDILILNTNGFIYDALTYYSLKLSHINIMPVEGAYPNVIHAKRNIEFMINYQQLPLNKNYFILFNHKKNQIGLNAFEEIINGYSLGNIKYHSFREGSFEEIYLPSHFKYGIQTKLYNGLIKTINKKINYIYEING